MLLFAASTTFASDFKGDWNNPEWDQMLLESLEDSGILEVDPVDAWKFTDQFRFYTDREKIELYAHIMINISKRESNYKPDCFYKESFNDSTGTKVVSRGLFQLSYEAATLSYRCDNIGLRSNLYDPKVNIDCAVKVFSRWVKVDKVISLKLSRRKYRGVARYWSTMRPGKIFNSIILRTKAKIKNLGLKNGHSKLSASLDSMNFDEIDNSHLNLKLAWDNKLLSDVLVNSLKDTDLFNIHLKNTPGYIGSLNTYSNVDKLVFYAELISWLAVEINSENLFDLKLDSISPLCEELTTEEDLLNDELNIKCAVKMIEHYITRDQKITGYKTINSIKNWQGIGSQWELFRDLVKMKRLFNRTLYKTLKKE